MNIPGNMKGKSVSVSASLEEKDRECSFELTRSHSRSRSFSVPQRIKVATMVGVFIRLLLL